MNVDSLDKVIYIDYIHTLLSLLMTDILSDIETFDPIYLSTPKYQYTIYIAY